MANLWRASRAVHISYRDHVSSSTGRNHCFWSCPGNFEKGSLLLPCQPGRLCQEPTVARTVGMHTGQAANPKSHTYPSLE